ncbi:YrrS family protein [Oceanobacillus sp. CAU 1775]
MDDMNGTRLKKFEKRRRNNIFIKYALIIAAVLVVLLIGIWIFGGGDEVADDSPLEDEQTEDEGFFIEVEEEDNDEDTKSSDNSNEDNDNEETNENESENNSDEEETNPEFDDVEVEVSESDDDNVIEVITGNWPPIGTEQTGPHETVFAEGSADRIEIKRAVSMVTGLAEDDINEIWVGNGGYQKVISTVSNSAYTDFYRVYLSWVDNEGWQPTMVEVLVENDI